MTVLECVRQVLFHPLSSDLIPRCLMPSFNRVTLIGNLTRDPETRDLPSGTTLCEFGLAMTRHFKTAGGDDREETCFIDCTAFGKQAEVLSQYLAKGRPLFVEGRLKYD